MAGNTYFERIEAIFEQVETGLEELPDDLDIRTAEGVINVTFGNGVVFVFSRQPPTEQLWLATPGGGVPLSVGRRSGNVARYENRRVVSSGIGVRVGATCWPHARLVGACLFGSLACSVALY